MFDNQTVDLYADLRKDIIDILGGENEAEIDKNRRIAAIFCVKNAWSILHSNGNSLNSFQDTFNGKKVISANMFSGLFRLWKVDLEDGSWLIAYDLGNGNFAQITKLNSYDNAG